MNYPYIETGIATGNQAYELFDVDIHSPGVSFYICLENKMTKIAAFSRRYPPNFKRRWYVVRNREGFFRIRYLGNTCMCIFISLNDALDAIEQIEALRKLGLVLERTF